MIHKQKTKGSADEIDAHVGKRLRLRRALLGFSQEKLADRIGLTFQQIQKYERGTNRISASRLWQFSKILDMPMNAFYQGLDENDCETLGIDLTTDDMRILGKIKRLRDASPRLARAIEKHVNMLLEVEQKND